MDSGALRVAVMGREPPEVLQLAARLQQPRLQALACGLEGAADAMDRFGPSLVVLALTGLERPGALRAAVERAGGRPVLLAGPLSLAPVWLLPFAAGVVGVLPLEALEPPAVLALAASLPGRPGAVRGSGAYGELKELLDSVELLGRSGTLEVQTAEGPGRCRLTRGVPGEARLGQRSGPEAWEALRVARGPWLFREHGAQPPEEAPAARAELDPRGTRLLLVSDELAPLAARSHHLARKGYQVVTAVDRAGGLESLSRGPFDAAVLDLAEGAELQRQLAQDLRSRETPVVLALGAGLRGGGGLARGDSPAQWEAAVRAALAPRGAVQARLRSWKVDDALAVDAGVVGVQWLLKELAACEVTGTLTLRAPLATAEAWFIEGRLCQARSAAAEGVDALAPLLTAPQVSATLEVVGLPQGEGFGGAATAVVLAQVVARAEATQGPTPPPRASGIWRAA